MCYFSKMVLVAKILNLNSSKLWVTIFTLHKTFLFNENKKVPAVLQQKLSIFYFSYIPIGGRIYELDGLQVSYFSLTLNQCCKTKFTEFRSGSWIFA